MTFKQLLLTSALCVGVAGVAGAQPRPHAFDDLDADADGFLTLAELEMVFDTGVGSEANPGAVLETETPTRTA